MNCVVRPERYGNQVFSIQDVIVGVRDVFYSNRVHMMNDRAAISVTAVNVLAFDTQITSKIPCYYTRPRMTPFR